MASADPPCPGCGLRSPQTDLPAHAYIGASPGCWQVYSGVLAREYGELRNPPYHRLTVDAYAAQHPGVPSRRSIQSVGGHLVALHLAFVRGFDPAHITRLMPRIVARGEGAFRWLTPPDLTSALSVSSVASAQSPGDHERAVYAWAESVWGAWAPHHTAVAEWAGATNGA